ncbi:tail fiber protein [Stenotrophomonas phage Pokken]|uniref:Putative tail fiber protein n=1 Tax=Stenotrophomonas phage Pokken TaxID=2596674 RepID=A0A5B9N525_9CAUD|nr:tail fiber protein [Stenotrophomonas phage Pokken]QEG09307.1 putative tail fiber protein [Stenotrophomonas phage Pokken]
MSTGIFQRPNVDQHGYLLPMRIGGTPAEYTLGDPYEGRLQVFNNVGSCTIQQTGGDELPNGHSISFDPDTNEIVITWPALFWIDPVTKIYAAEISDPGFESGSAKKGWEMGLGWSVNNINNITGSYSACFMDFNGSSHILNKARHKVEPGTVINAQCTVRQGASAKYNVGALVTIQYFDDKGNMIHIDRGNLVDDGAKNRVSPSRLASTVPAGAVTCSIGCEGVRFKENKELFVDDFKWDLEVTEIIESPNPLNEYNVELTATDSIGRIARWSGPIKMAGVYVTSKLYGFYDHEDLGMYASLDELRIQEMEMEVSPLEMAASFISLDLRSIRRDYAHPNEDILQLGSDFVSITIRTIRRDYAHAFDPEDGMRMSSSFQSITIKQHPRVDQPLEDHLTLSSSFVSLEFGS